MGQDFLYIQNHGYENIIIFKKTTEVGPTAENWLFDKHFF